MNDVTRSVGNIGHFFDIYIHPVDLFTGKSEYLTSFGSGPEHFTMKKDYVHERRFITNDIYGRVGRIGQHALLEHYASVAVRTSNYTAMDDSSYQVCIDNEFLTLHTKSISIYGISPELGLRIEFRTRPFIRVYYGSNRFGCDVFWEYDFYDGVSELFHRISPPSNVLDMVIHD